MSTDLIAHLNYMSLWQTESDAHIDSVIDEFNLFRQLGDFESDVIIDSEFEKVVSLAKTVRDLTIANDAIKIAADAAAISMIWSFGIGGAAFIALEAAAVIEGKEISSKSKDLNDKLETLDKDIASRINSNVSNYIAKYKANNSLIANKIPEGLDMTRARAILFQFMGDVNRKEGKLDAITFRKYAASVNALYNSAEIEDVYDALDELNMSDRSPEDIQKFVDTLIGFKPSLPFEFGFVLVQSLSLSMLKYKLKIAEDKIKKAVDRALPEAEAAAAATQAEAAAARAAANTARARLNELIEAEAQGDAIAVAAEEAARTESAAVSAETEALIARNAIAGATDAVSTNSFKAMDGCGKFAASVTIGIAILDAFLMFLI